MILLYADIQTAPGGLSLVPREPDSALSLSRRRLATRTRSRTRRTETERRLDERTLLPVIRALRGALRPSSAAIQYDLETQPASTLSLLAASIPLQCLLYHRIPGIIWDPGKEKIGKTRPRGKGARALRDQSCPQVGMAGICAPRFAFARRESRRCPACLPDSLSSDEPRGFSLFPRTALAFPEQWTCSWASWERTM